MTTHYDYYKSICVCRPLAVIIGIGDQNCNEIESWPVDVYNVQGTQIGTAANKSQYINIWNSDIHNKQIGTLYNFIGPFSFLLLVNPGQMIPFCLGGTPGISNYLLLENGGRILKEDGSGYLLRE